MAIHHDELTRLASREPVSGERPDLVAILRQGRRLRTRRRVATGVASLAVVAAIGIPVGLAAHDPSADAPVGPATSGVEPTAGPTSGTERRVLPEGCGILGCPAEATPETGDVVGKPWLVGGLDDGTDEVIYAVRQPAGVRVLATGFRDGDGLTQAAQVLRPGLDPGPLTVWGGLRRQGPDGATYTIVGMVEGDQAQVSWRSGSGSFRAVDVNHDLASGYTVFWFADEWDDAWPADEPAPVAIRVDGQQLDPTTVE